MRNWEPNFDYITTQLEEIIKILPLNLARVLMVLEESYKPLFQNQEREHNKRIDLYQREIELLKGDLKRLRAEKGLNFVGLVGDYRIYAKKEKEVEPVIHNWRGELHEAGIEPHCPRCLEMTNEVSKET